MTGRLGRGAGGRRSASSSEEVLLTVLTCAAAGEKRRVWICLTRSGSESSGGRGCPRRSPARRRATSVTFRIAVTVSPTSVSPCRKRFHHGRGRLNFKTSPSSVSPTRLLEFRLSNNKPRDRISEIPTRPRRGAARGARLRGGGRKPARVHPESARLLDSGWIRVSGSESRISAGGRRRGGAARGARLRGGGPKPCAGGSEFSASPRPHLRKRFRISRLVPFRTLEAAP